jgi:protoporphyrinogen oxidase
VKIGIIGAGTMGMTLGYRLAQAGHDVTILESGPQEGGLATWRDYGDFTWDKYYHVILKQDEHLLGLIDELGIGDRMQWRETKTGFLWNGKLVSMSNNWEFLTFPVLSLFAKLRLGLGILYIQRVNDPAPLERTTSAAWLRRVFGRTVYDRIWEPLLESKFGALKDRVPATIMWATIRRYYATRNKGDGKETLGFVSGGMRGFYAALRQAIEDRGGRIELGAEVRRIENEPDGVCVTVGDDVRMFDRVVSTVPTRVLERLAPEFDGPIAASSRPQFLGVVSMSLVLRKALTKYYVTNLVERGLPFTGIIEITALTGPREMNGRHLVMLPRYDLPESEWFSRPESEITAEFFTALRRIWPDIDANVVDYHVSRTPLVQALWMDQPPASSGPAVSSDGRLWCVNAELAGRDTLNNNAIVNVANGVADAIGSSPAGRIVAGLGVRGATATPTAS